MSTYSFPFEDDITQKVFLNNGIDKVLTKKQKNSLLTINQTESQRL